MRTGISVALAHPHFRPSTPSLRCRQPAPARPSNLAQASGERRRSPKSRLMPGQAQRRARLAHLRGGKGHPSPRKRPEWPRKTRQHRWREAGSPKAACRLGRGSRGPPAPCPSAVAAAPCMPRQEVGDCRNRWRGCDAIASFLPAHCLTCAGTRPWEPGQRLPPCRRGCVRSPPGATASVPPPAPWPPCKSCGLRDAVAVAATKRWS